jgi:sulfatase modifying factor 1
MPVRAERESKLTGRVLAAPLALLIGHALFPGAPRRERPAEPAPTRAIGTAPVPAAAVSSGAPPLAAPDADSACGEMAKVEGQYCPTVEHVCARWLDPPESPFARCAEYARPARCKAPRVWMSFCIDRREYTAPGETLPMNQASLNIESKLCTQLGKRLCTEREWNFACEGEEMRPYPYGWERRPVCNQDRTDLYLPDLRRQVLADRRWPSGSRPECVSPFGVFDLVGNLDEPVLKDPPGHAPLRTALKGGWWMPARNRCRPATTAHDDHFTGIQIGVRCCRDVEETISSTG